MRALLDTHTLLWWLDGDLRLSRPARRLIADDNNSILVSAASAWEISTKVRLGKLAGAIEVATELPVILRQQDFAPLPITLLHALRAGNLPGPYRDPFDRMLIAQAQAEDLVLVSNERIFDTYGVRRIW